MANKTKHIIEMTALDKTKAAFKSIKGGLGGVAKFAGGAAAGVLKVGLAATAAATAVSIVAKKSFDFADAIGKVSTRTGMATDTIQAFQIAAVESGSSVEIANKSLEKFTRSVGDAQRGLKTQADIFKDLGVSIEDSNGNTKDMDTLLREVSDGMAGLQSQSEKATVAANLFGRAGIQIIDVLDDGGAAFDAYIDKAKAYGLILNEQGIRQSEKFNDTLSFITRQIQTATAAVSIAFLPILQNLATSFKELTASTVAGEDGVMKFGETVRDTVLNTMDGFLRSIADTLDSFNELRVQLFGVGITLGNMASKAERTGNALMFVAAATKGNITMAVTYAAKMATATVSIKDANKEMQKYRAELSSGSANIRAFADDLKTYFIDVLGKSAEEADNLLDAYNALFKQPNTNITDIGSPLQAFKQEFKDINKLIETSTVNAIKKMEDQLVDFVMTGKASFGDLARSIIADLARIQIRKGLTKFAAMIGIEGFEGGGFTGHGARSGGIDGRGGFPAILHPNETVIDHTKGQQVSQQQPVNVNFSIQATDAAGVDQILASRKNQIIAMINQAMNQKGKVGLT